MLFRHPEAHTGSHADARALDVRPRSDDDQDAFNAHRGARRGRRDGARPRAQIDERREARAATQRALERVVARRARTRARAVRRVVVVARAADDDDYARWRWG